MRRIIFVAAVLGVVAVAAGNAQQNRIVLDSGPTRGRGLLFLPVNVIEYYTGTYVIGEQTITVYATEHPIVVYPSWRDYGCRGNAALLVEEDDETVLVYLEDGRKWRVFIDMPKDYTDSCLFVDTFLKRFIYFQQVRESPVVPPFPAILELH